MRKEHMQLDVPLFRQTTDFTCGACATLMVLKYFDRKVRFSVRNEFLIWSKTAALPFKFSSPYRIAAFFVKERFETRLIMEHRASTGKVPRECCDVDSSEQRLFLRFLNAHNAILKKKIASVTLGRKPTISDVKTALIGCTPVIVLIDSYYTDKIRGAQNLRHLPHWIVVTGYEGDLFYVNDSTCETRLKPGDTILESRLLRKAMDMQRVEWPPALITVGPRVR